PRSGTDRGRRNPHRHALIDDVVRVTHLVGRGRLDIPDAVGAHGVVGAGAHHAEVLRRADETSGVVRIGVVELGYEDRLDRVAGRGHGDADVVRAVAVDGRAALAAGESGHGEFLATVL